jgi:hypothetical protein
MDALFATDHLTSQTKFRQADHLLRPARPVKVRAICFRL